MPDLDLILRANVSSATAGLQKAEQGLAKTAIAAQKVDSSLLKSVKSTNEAAFALDNLGRVAQDAPFGFIGIANNLNPLLESFQRLKATSGSTGSALKAMAASLTGPAGIGFAISIVSSLLIVFGDRLFKTSKEIDKTKEAFDGLVDSIAKESLNLRESFAAVQDANIPLENRKKIIDNLRSSYGAYLKNISDEALLTGKAAAAYDLINAAILKKLQLQALEEKILPFIKEQVNLQFQLNELQKEAVGIRQFIDAATGANQAKVQKDLSVAIAGSNENLGKQLAIQRRIARVGKDIDSIFRGITPLLQFDEVSIQGINAKKIKEDIQRQIFPEGILTDVFPIKISPTVDIDLDKTKGSLQDSIDRFLAEIRRLAEARAEVIEDMGFKLPENFFAISKEDQEKLVENFKQISEITKSAVADLFVSISENIGNLKNPLAGIFEILGAALTKLGVYVILSSKLVASVTSALNAALSGPGGLGKGIALGISLVVLGTVLKNIPKLASGGIVPPGYPNDSFPAFLQSNEAVIPLDRINDFLRPSAASQPIVLTPILRGSDIYLQQKRFGESVRRGR